MQEKPKTDIEETFIAFLQRVARGECTEEEAAWVERLADDWHSTTPTYGEPKKPTKPRKTKAEVQAAKQQAILNTALEVHFKDAVDAKTLGFLGRAFVMATLPHKKVQGNEYIRKNGDYRPP